MGKGTGSETTMSLRSVLQKDYLQGLDNLRKLVTNIECDLDRLKREFYCCQTNEEEAYETHLKLCNERFLYCNNKLRKQQGTLDVIDGEVKLVSMLNKVRDLDDNVDPEVISFLTAYWERIKGAVEGLQTIQRKFSDSCLKRLKSSCVSYQDDGLVSVELARNYAKEVTNYQDRIVSLLETTDQLEKSYTLGVKHELFTESRFTNWILVCCDQKAFPILRLVPDLSEKLTEVCQLARQWIDKDEIYVHELSSFIRETRTQTRKRAIVLRNKKEKQSQLSVSVNDAFNLFKEHKNKLAKIDSELKTLSQTVKQYTDTKRYKEDEMRQKEGIVGFLEISIAQTNKNYTLQLKRSRLARQLRELEENLKDIEQELTQMVVELEEKDTEKSEIEGKFEETNSTYTSLKTELEGFNSIVGNLQKEVNELSGSLTQLEIIQNVKTCPERVEDFYERPPTVRLAPSLKEKIMARKRILMGRTEKEMANLDTI